MGVAAVATIGMFDGVHEGHRFVIRHVCNYAREHGLASMAITFDRHPREVVQDGFMPQLLTTFDERMQLLEKTGIDYCVVLPFTRELAALTAHDFMQLMREQLGVKVLLTGYDNRFGHDRNDTFDDYVRYGRETGIQVRCLPPTQLCRWAPSGQGTPSKEQGRHVSSSLIRELLTEGDISEAARCLGYNYTLSGTVVKGEHVGTTLGFPTANLQPEDPCKLIPKTGVYAVTVEGLTAASSRLAMMNIGTRPTFGPHRQTLEVHILDYDGDLYGQTLRVSFLKRLRDERPFADEEELKAQLHEDEQQVRNMIR